jgi:hypothetical protein
MLVVVTEVIDVDFVAGDLVVGSTLDKVVVDEVGIVLLEIAVDAVKAVSRVAVDWEAAMVLVVSINADSLAVAWVRRRGDPSRISSIRQEYIVEKWRKRDFKS